MSKKITFYANCQGIAIAKTLQENSAFADSYYWEKIEPIQNLKAAHVPSVIKTISTADVIVYQAISNRGRPSELSSQSVLQHAKRDAKLISIPSLYFDGYFPHLSSMNGLKGVLNLVHDYCIAYAYCKGIGASDCFEMLQSEDLYSPELSKSLFEKSLDNLKRRERQEQLDISISNYIEENFRNKKLFNQFNHPTRKIFEFISNQIIERLSIEQIAYDTSSQRGYLDAIITPIYRSTYHSLGLRFEEDFETYWTVDSKQYAQAKIIDQFYRLYNQMDRSDIITAIQEKKPFVSRMIDKYQHPLIT